MQNQPIKFPEIKTVYLKFKLDENEYSEKEIEKVNLCS